MMEGRDREAKLVRELTVKVNTASTEIIERETYTNHIVHVDRFIAMVCNLHREINILLKIDKKVNLP
jgi:hypothetical protein